MSPSSQYYERISTLIRTIYENEAESIQAAAEVLVEQIVRGNLIHVLGTGGHSTIGAEEMFYRAGGLVPINAIFETGLSLQLGGRRSNVVERVPGYMPGILNTYGVKAGEVLIIVNAYGINCATIDAALEAKRRGLTVIGVTGTETAAALPPDHPSRHPSGQNLYEIADIFINTYLPVGDAVVDIEGFSEKVASVSSITNVFTLELLVAETINLLVLRGIDPPVWKSANSVGGDEYNLKYYEKYVGLVRHL